LTIKVIEVGISRQPICDFLLVKKVKLPSAFLSPLTDISYRLGVVAA